MSDIQESNLSRLVGAVNNFNKAVRNLLRVLFLLSLARYIAIIDIIIIIFTVIINSNNVISVALIRTFGLEFHPKPSGDA